MGFLSNKIWVRIFLGHPVRTVNWWSATSYNYDATITFFLIAQQWTTSDATTINICYSTICTQPHVQPTGRESVNRVSINPWIVYLIVYLSQIVYLSPWIVYLPSSKRISVPMRESTQTETTFLQRAIARPILSMFKFCDTHRTAAWVHNCRDAFPSWVVTNI